MGLISLILLAILAVPTLQEKIYSSGPEGMLWQYDKCPMLAKIRGSLQECEDVCSLNDKCNAFNFVSAGVDTRCELLKCPIPIPKPNWKYGQGWLGYYQVTDQGECHCVKEELERIREQQAHLENLLKEQGDSQRGTMQEELDRIKEHLEKLLKEQGESHRETMQEELGRIKELLHSMSDSISSLSKNISSLWNDTSLTESLKNNTTLHKECPETDGFFTGPGQSNQCFKAFYAPRPSRNWSEAVAKCATEGMVIAKPMDPVALMNYLHTKFGSCYFWIGARGTGSTIQWLHDRTIISKDDPAWDSWHNHPKSTADTHCLRITALAFQMKNYPNEPYQMQPCTERGFNLGTLCELL